MDIAAPNGLCVALCMQLIKTTKFFNTDNILMAYNRLKQLTEQSNISHELQLS